jgi:hypothetical protein
MVVFIVSQAGAIMMLITAPIRLPPTRRDDVLPPTDLAGMQDLSPGLCVRLALAGQDLST